KPRQWETCSFPPCNCPGQHAVSPVTAAAPDSPPPACLLLRVALVAAPCRAARSGRSELHNLPASERRRVDLPIALRLLWLNQVVDNAGRLLLASCPFQGPALPRH